MAFPDNIIAAEAALNEHELDWQCSMFARRHLHSSESQLRAEIERIARAHPESQESFRDK